MILHAVKASGKIGILIGQQNSEHFRTLEDVDAFYQMGQRVSQLTYYHNRLGGGSTDARDPGLSPYGGEVVARMNQSGNGRGCFSLWRQDDTGRDRRI